HILFIEGELFGIAIFTIGGLILALVPFLDRKSTREQKSQVFKYFGYLMLLFIIVMTVIGYIVE
ncbi:MAG: cytochrome B, partial [candidate division Zixibacteria bacterium]|nr:cytochrome B [candidate division Zixibacteria bacterium]